MLNRVGSILVKFVREALFNSFILLLFSMLIRFTVLFLNISLKYSSEVLETDIIEDELSSAVELMEIGIVVDED